MRCLRVFLLAACVPSLLAVAHASAQPAERSWIAQRDLLEDWLANAEVQNLEEVGEGVTNPSKVTLMHEGTTFYAIFKPLERGRHRGFWESYQAEVAAYKVDKMLGLDMVPPTVVRRINNSLGSLQLWVEGCDTYKRLEARVPQTPGFSWQISRMKMFDNLIFNEDRNAGNFLLDEAWNIVLIDHSRAFLDRKRLLKEKTQLPAQYDRTLVKKLQAMNLEALESELDDLLMGGQIESILDRRDKLLQHLQQLIAERGEGSVLFN